MATTDHVLIAEAARPQDFLSLHLQARTWAPSAERGTVLVPSSSPAVTQSLVKTCALLDCKASVAVGDTALQLCSGAAAADAVDFVALYERTVAPIINLDRGKELSSALQDTPVILSPSSRELALACQYGLLTDRPVCRGSLGQTTLERLQGARSVLIVLPDTWTTMAMSAFLTVLARVPDSPPIAFVYPYGPRDLFPLRSFLYQRVEAARHPYTFVYPLEGKSQAFSVGRADFLAGVHPVAETLRLLTRPASYLFATPHSNGLDMSLGSVVLCARADRAAGDPRPEQALPCYYADVCNRLTNGNTLLGSSSLRSIVAFFYTCWGVLLQGGAYDTEISLGYQLAHSPYSAALLTTFSSSPLDRSLGIWLAERLSENVPIGAAVAEANQQHFSRYADRPFVIAAFGDPEFRFGRHEPLGIAASAGSHEALDRFAQATALQLAAGASPPKTAVAAPVGDETFAAMDFSRCVVNGSRRVPRPDLRAPVEALSTATEQLWVASALINSRWAQRSRIDVASPMAGFRPRLQVYQRAWAEYYKTLVAQLGGYVRFQVDRYFVSGVDEAPADRACPYCSGPVAVSIHTLCGAPHVRRRHEDCLNCATIVDAPAATSGTIACARDWTPDGDVPVSLEIDLPHAGAEYLALVVVEPFKKPAAQVVAFSQCTGVVGDATPGRMTIVPLPLRVAGLGAGSYYLNALCLVDASVVLLRRMVYVRRHTEEA